MRCAGYSDAEDESSFAGRMNPIQLGANGERGQPIVARGSSCFPVFSSVSAISALKRRPPRCPSIDELAGIAENQQDIHYSANTITIMADRK
jgi:hypothetical protein